jgi:hypothetical protein
LGLDADDNPELSIKISKIIEQNGCQQGPHGLKEEKASGGPRKTSEIVQSNCCLIKEESTTKNQKICSAINVPGSY